MQIQRFNTFAACKDIWQTLEKTTFLYPFQSWWYQNLFASHFSKNAEIFLLGVFDDTALLAIGTFEIVRGEVTFLGTKNVSDNAAVIQDITDFGDIAYTPTAEKRESEIWKALQTYFKEKGYTAAQLYYVRQDSPTYRVSLSLPHAKLIQQETSPFISLPYTWETYLASLDKKQRHELNRKLNRLEKEAAFHFCKDQTIEIDFDEFVRLHRLSDSQKAKFMTQEMQRFFWNLVTCEKENWQIHFCSLFIDDKQVASVMAFMNSSHTLLYNSGFDPAYAYFSAGLLVKAYLLKKSIAQKKTTYDFLRGSERYKYDLGAKDLPLYHISLSL